MKIIHIENRIRVLKTEEEKEREFRNCKNEMAKAYIGDYKFIPTDKPIYIVEMTNEEYQLISFYLELERRKPIMNMKIDIEKEILK